MSNWSFEEMGEFGSAADAERWAKRQGLAPQDVRIPQGGRSGAGGPTLGPRR